MDILIIIHVIVVTCLILVILMQRSSAEGFTGASNTGNSMMSGRAKGNILTKTTAILATFFIINSMLLTYLSSNRNSKNSLFENGSTSSDVPAIPSVNDGKITEETPEIPDI